MKANSIDDPTAGMGELFEGNPKTGVANPLTTGKTQQHVSMHLKRILVPVDFSRCSAKALQYAIPFARQFGAELVLLHVIPPAVVLPTSEIAPPAIIEESTEISRHHLDELRQSVGKGISARAFLRKGSPHMEIIDAAKELDIDLIIISTHGRTGLSHVLMGNTAEKVVRRAGCPVLVVREHEHEFISVD